MPDALGKYEERKPKYEWPDSIEIDGQSYRIDHSFEQPNLAGSSRNRKTLFFDKGWNPWGKVDGKWVDRLPFVARHEVFEKKAIDAGHKYLDAHEHFANPAEKHAVQQGGHSWKSYEGTFDQELHHCEHEKHVNLPKDEDKHQFTDVNRKRRRN